jgi:sugar phosphate isomerase/epimerase
LPAEPGPAEPGPAEPGPAEPGLRRPSLPIGVDSFSFHRWFGETNQWEEPLDERWTTADLFAYVGGLDLDVLSLQTIHLPPLSPAVVEATCTAVAELGVELILAWGHRSGLREGYDPDKLDEALAAVRAGHDMGCAIVRVVCGDQTSWTTDSSVRAANIKRLLGPLQAIAEQAEVSGLSVAVENHADRTMDDLLALVSSVGSKRLGVCFDVGNAVRVGDDPVEAAKAAAPFTFMVHWRDLPLRGRSRQGPDEWWPCTALGQGDLDIPGVLDALVRGGQSGPWLVEASNVLPGGDEREMVAASLSYLRSFRG